MRFIYIGVAIVLILLYFLSIENFETEDFEQALRNRLAELQRQEQELEQDEFDFRENKMPKEEKLARIRAKELKCQELLDQGIHNKGKALLGIYSLMNPFLIASWPGAALAAGYSLVGPSESDIRKFCFEDDYYEKLPFWLQVLDMDNRGDYRFHHY